MQEITLTSHNKINNFNKFYLFFLCLGTFPLMGGGRQFNNFWLNDLLKQLKELNLIIEDKLHKTLNLTLKHITKI